MKRFKLFLIILTGFCVFTIYSTPIVNAAISVVTNEITNTAEGANSVFAIDIDEDGDIDVLSASFLDATVAWYENDGSESFTKHDISTTADGARSVFAIDIDNDGDIDVLSANRFDNTVAWYENDGSENFTEHAVTTGAWGAYSVFAIDVDNDGDIDVLSANNSIKTIAWYENDGSEVFTEHVITNTAIWPSSVYATDVDADGDIDILGAIEIDDTIAWYENDGSEVFTERVITNTADGASSVYAIDVDKDGDMDVLSASNVDDTIAWYENNGNKVFTEHAITTTAEKASSVYAADIDGDGDIDVLSASDYDGTIAWYENDGSESFTKNVIISNEYGASSVYAIDIDNDGYLNILATFIIDDLVTWYEISEEYTLTFNDYNSTLLGTEDISANGVATTVPTPVRDGYTLTGWTDGTNTYAPDLSDFTMSAVNTTLIATYTLNEYTVTFDSQGGSLVDSKTTNYNTSLSLNIPTAPTKTGYTFIGWNTQTDGLGSTFTSATAVTNKITVYAQWSINQYTVTFDSQGGSLVDSKTTNCNTSLSLNMPTTPTKHGYTFIGWNTQTDGLGSTFTSATAVTNEMTVYAQWIINQYTVIFDSQGVGGVDSKTIDYDTSLSNMPTIPTKPGYIFDQWNTQADGLGTTFTSATSVTEDITVYALFIDILEPEISNIIVNTIDLTYNDIYITITVSDNEAVNFVTVNENSVGNVSVIDNFDGTYTFTASINGTYVVMATDVAGNVASSTVIIDDIYIDIPIDNADLVVVTNEITNTADGDNSVYAIDVDGDGDIDVLSATNYGDKIAWYENDGSENFTEHVITNTAASISSTYATDLDGDGDIDVLSVSQSDQALEWYENNGTEGFLKHTITTTADGNFLVYANDVDGDGDIDILSGGYTASWYENNGNEIFTKHIILSTYEGSLYTNDVDGDGDVDVLSISYFDNTIEWYENMGSDSFSRHIITTTAEALVSIYAIDVDKDGDLDVLSISDGGYAIEWYENMGSESFTKHVVTTSSKDTNSIYSIYAIDADKDGDIDVLSASYVDNTISWYENNGSESFTEHTITTTAEGVNSVYATDIDGDGDIDVLSANTYDNTIKWYEIEEFSLTTNKYTLTYNDYNNLLLSTEDISANGEATTVPAPIRDGYSLTGWTDGTNTYFVDLSDFIMPERSETLTAVYTTNQYIVTFDSQDGTELNTKITDYNTSLTSNMPTNPTKPGYTFVGWNTQADGLGSTFTSATSVTRDITVYALYQGSTNPVIDDISGNVTEWTDNDVFITITVSDEKGIESLKVNGNIEGNIRVTDNLDGTYSFTANSNDTYTIIVTNLSGNTTIDIIAVTYIDKDIPVITAINQSVQILDCDNFDVLNGVTVTDTSSNASINDLVITYYDSDDAVIDDLALFKTALSNAEDNEVFTIKYDVTDKAGNSATSVTVNITAETLMNPTDIEEGQTFKGEASITFEEGTATLNGKSYISGTKISDPGEYTLVVTDELGNETTINFVIEPSVNYELVGGLALVAILIVLGGAFYVKR